MKKYLLIPIYFFCFSKTVDAQVIRLAILDFDNISGIAKYDGLGKAMSSMLISDIEANVSPKRLQLVERSQIQKIIKEQKFQLSGSVNKNTVVQAGKILGVKYLLIGDIFIFNDQLILNARLTNTETGDIVFSKKQEGKTIGWLSLKTNIAKDLANSLSMPFSEPRIRDASITPAVLTTYANAIDEKDKGNFEKAETLINTAIEFDTKFGYLDDLRNEVEALKIGLKNLEVQVETAVENPISAAINFRQKKDYKNSSKYLLIGLKRLNSNQYGKKYFYYRLLTENYYLEADYLKSIAFADSILKIFTHDDNAIYFKSMSFVKQNKIEPAISMIKTQLSNYSQAWSVADFLKQIKIFEEATGFKFGDFDINPLYDNPFVISIDGKYEYEGEYFLQGNFNQQLNRFANLLQYLKKTPTEVADAINSVKIKDKLKIIPKFNLDKPYYLPSSRFESQKTQDKELVFANTGEFYFGDYYITYDGVKYTGVSPQSCPCRLLYTAAEYDHFKKYSDGAIEITIENLLERERVFVLGWYYLLAKNSDNSIIQYSKLLDYYKPFQSNYLKFQSLSSADKEKIRLSEINIGHSYLLKNDFANALIYYKKSDLNIEFTGLDGKTSRDVISDNWKDLIEKGVFTNKLIEEFKFQAPEIFK
jgi:TolB-like protein